MCGNKELFSFLDKSVKYIVKLDNKIKITIWERQNYN